MGCPIDEVKIIRDDKIYYEIDLENDITDVEIELKIDEVGVIFDEVIEFD